MKAILVIDMPDSCAVCQYRINKNHWRCLAVKNERNKPTYIHRTDGDCTRERPSWCPLKPMPSKKKVIVESKPKDYFSEYAEGWNACLRAVLRVGEFEEIAE